jgi:Na+/H+-dicarboxylate symporter
MKKRLTLYIVVGMVLGLIAGYICHRASPDAAAASTTAGYFSIVTTVFLSLIKMIIAPLVFATLVSGLAGMGGSSSVARLGFRTIAWFVCASLISLSLGLLLANLLKPGAGLHLVASDADAPTSLKAPSFNLSKFITDAFPSSVFNAMAHNEVIQILVFAVFFGVALGALKDDPRVQSLIEAIDGLVVAMLKVTNYVMNLAPFGVFAAIASAVTEQGLGVLVTYGKLISYFYLGLLLLWVILIGVGYLFIGKSMVSLLKQVREPALLAFSTASSEAAYPRLIEKLEKFGIDKKIVGFVLPLGYAFNLDGSMMYQAFAALFIAQAFGIEMPLAQQIFMLLVLMVSSKGMASVPRGSLVVVAAVMPLFHLPAAGMLLVLAIDQILDMGRTATNVIGNSIATAVVAKWEAQRQEERQPEPSHAGGRNAVGGTLRGQTK